MKILDLRNQFTIPPPLQPGDRVYVVSPSSAIAGDVFEKGIRNLKELGLVPVYRPDVTTASGDLAGTHERRVVEFRAALRDPSTKAIWAARGGYGAGYLLSHFDVEEVRRARKWLVGFSDITVLHALWARAGLASLHGALISVLGAWSDAAKNEMREYLFCNIAHELRGVGLRSGPPALGFLAGGNITMLASMAGTPYLPSWKGAIVVLEDLTTESYRIDRPLLQLLQAGAFNGIKGVVIGQVTDLAPIGADATTAKQRAEQFVLQHLDVPVLTGVEIGHEPTSRAMMLGAEATLDASEGCLTIHATSRANTSA